MKTFGNRLREAIKADGISEADFCRYTGFSHQYLSHIIHDTQKPSFKTLQKILQKLPDVDGRWLILGQ